MISMFVMKTDFS